VVDEREEVEACIVIKDDAVVFFDDVGTVI
jgi:hypothetical protein